MAGENLGLLRKNYLFAKLTDAELGELEPYLESRSYNAAEFVVKEGDPGDSLYLVASGGVNVTKNPDGHFLSYLGSGGYFGEMALFMPNSARTANCVAALPTKCLILQKDALEKYAAQHPVPGNKIYREIIRALAERLAATSGDLAMLMRSQVKDQVDVSAIMAKLKK